MTPMELLAPVVSAHLDRLVPPRPPEMAHMEQIAADTNFPIIGPAAGYFCYLVARLTGARNIFELGSGFGYSTAWFARAIRENGGGTVHHVVWDADLSRRAQRHLTALGYSDLVQYRVGEAVQWLGETSGPFDIIFNDIDKSGYPAAMDVIVEKLRPGGALIIDNLLWHGRIFDENDSSPDTEGVRELTRRVFQSPEWSPSLVPIRDGLLLAMKN
jgi:caffeoyl-CoA O-methyltransferase